MAKIVAIHSYRGGTGKSNICANVAAAVALQGKRVGLIDTDIPSPGIHFIFGLEQGSGVDKTLNDYLWNRCAVEDAAYDVTPLEIRSEAGLIYLIPSSVNADDIAKVLTEGYDFKKLNEAFRRFGDYYNLDYIFVDSHPGLNKETLLSITVSNLLLLILRPDRQDYQGTAVTVDIAKRLRVKNINLIINKALPSMNLNALRLKVQQTYNLNVAGLLPLSPDMMQLGSTGIFYLKYPDHDFTAEIGRIAMQVLSV